MLVHQRVPGQNPWAPSITAVASRHPLQPPSNTPLQCRVPLMQPNTPLGRWQCSGGPMLLANLMYSTCWLKFSNYHSKNNWSHWNIWNSATKKTKHVLNILESSVLGSDMPPYEQRWHLRLELEPPRFSTPTEAPLLLKHVHNLPRGFVAEELSQLLFVVPRKAAERPVKDPLGDTQQTQPIRHNKPRTWCHGTPPRQWTFPEDIDERPQKRCGWFGGDQNNQGWYDMYKQVLIGDDIYIYMIYYDMR